MFSMLAAAAAVAIVHTVLGPDHYVPFIAMSKSGGWSFKKTAVITLLCGLAHVLSAVLLCLPAMRFSAFLGKIEIIEQLRGGIASWALLSFGLIYFIWGVKKIFAKKEYADNKTRDFAFWVIFAIFLFGPCEPLIPVLLYNHAAHSAGTISAQAGVFCLFTLTAMLGLVLGSVYGISFIKTEKFSRYSHALAGAAVFACGFAMVFLGL